MSNRWIDPTPDEPEDARSGKDDAAGIARDVAAAARHAPAGDSGAAADPGMDYGWDVSVNPADPPAEGAAGSAPTPTPGDGSAGTGDAQFVSYHQDTPGPSAPQADWVHPDDATVVSHPDAGGASDHRPDWVHPDDAGAAAGPHSPADAGSAGGPDWVHPDAGGRRPDWVHPDDAGAGGGPGSPADAGSSGAPDWVNPNPPPSDGGTAAAPGAGGPEWVNPNPPPGAPSAGTPPHTGGSGAGVAPGPQPGPHHPVPGADGMVNAGYGGPPPTGPGAMAQPPAAAMPQAPTPQPQWYGPGAPGAPQGIGPAAPGYGPGMPPGTPPPGFGTATASAGAAAPGGSGAAGGLGAAGTGGGLGAGSSAVAGIASGGILKTTGLILAVTLPLGFGSYGAVTHLAERGDSSTSASENLPPLPSEEYVWQVASMDTADTDYSAFSFQNDDGVEVHCAFDLPDVSSLGVGACATAEKYWDLDSGDGLTSVNLKSGKSLDDPTEEHPLPVNHDDIWDAETVDIPRNKKLKMPDYWTGVSGGWVYYDGYYLMKGLLEGGEAVFVLSPEGWKIYRR
ncbi:hypothetical protein [Corynebacterium sphenisci]|uniref:hypothetical protein n=1 Tax=Corynebacterium sphenisci TaxID=191493 RepID=UPI0026DFA83A|nr:hypothetical protein [Corynebacterium sphenisci]MDO5731720.1 hypothetical protein [Corynebacterium sphenisci]